MKKNVGYARVGGGSEADMCCLEAQIVRLKEAGCDIIFRESVPGKSSETKELLAAIASLEPGDNFNVDSRNRLALDRDWYNEVSRAVIERGVPMIWMCVEDNCPVMMP